MAWWKFWEAPISIEGVCKHQTTYAAYAFAEKYPVRIAIGIRAIYGKPGLHVQAQAQIDGKWEWLNIRYPFVQVGVQDSSFEILRYAALRTWFDFNVFDTVIEANK